MSIDIGYLLEKSRQQGPASKLKQRLEYLWQSCAGEVTEQSDLFRLTFATENLKDQGWNNQPINDRDWRAGQFSASQLNRNGFYVEKTALNAAYTEKGRQIKSVESRYQTGRYLSADIYAVRVNRRKNSFQQPLPHRHADTACIIYRSERK